ncbi:MAG: hypothetical protein P1P93_10000 [Gammaproteobacteria bacterium]|nr:hypothetical protein [Gammaproteobacteria bacterium]
MSHEFKLDIGHEIIEAEYTGIVTFEERMKAIEEGVTILNDREYPRIIVNLIAAEMQLTPDEKITLAQYVSEQHALINAKTAFLIRCEQTEREKVDQAVLRADEFDSKVFYSRFNAIEWLTGNVG